MISVIVPVYNVEKYLCRCVDSILAQSYTDFEIVLVDDGSTDGSGSICDNYLSDSRVRVFHKSNGGASSARNYGLLVAKGEWVVFVDADDWCEPKYLEALSSGGDVDYSIVFMSVDNNGVRENCHISYPKSIYRGGDQVSEFMNLCYREFSPPVCRRYKRNIILANNLRFDENAVLMEDSLFNFLYLKYVDSVCVIPQILYRYEKHEGSLTSRPINWDVASYIINELERSISGFKNYEQLSQYYIWGNILRKYFMSLQPMSIYKMSLKLNNVMSNQNVCKLFSGVTSHRSFFRKLFDFLMRNEIFYFAAILLKVEGLMLRHKLIQWR